MGNALRMYDGTQWKRINKMLNSASAYGIKKAAYFDGIDDWLQLSGESDFAFGTNDFCIEFILNNNTALANYVFYDSRPLLTQGAYVTLGVHSGELYFTTMGASRISTPISINKDYHVALARSGHSTKLFVDGIQKGSIYSDYNNYLNASNRPLLGGHGYEPTSTTNRNWSGYIRGIRITNGDARYTTDFTPPTSLLVDSINVKLCMVFSEPTGATTFIDQCGNTVTTIGDVVMVNYNSTPY